MVCRWELGPTTSVEHWVSLSLDLQAMVLAQSFGYESALLERDTDPLQALHESLAYLEVCCRGQC